MNKKAEKASAKAAGNGKQSKTAAAQSSRTKRPAKAPEANPKKRLTRTEKLKAIFSEGVTVKEPEIPKAPLTRGAAIRELADRANRGNPESLTNLRHLLDICPEIWEQAGNLTAIAEGAWIGLIGGTDHLSTESLKRTLAEMKAALKGEHPTPLESLLVDQIAVSWLSHKHAEIQAASATAGSLDQAAFQLRRAESAQKRHLNALKTLATMRALLSKGIAPTDPSIRLFDPDQKLA